MTLDPADANTLRAVAVMALVTLATRWGGVAAMAFVPLGARMRRFIAAMSGSVLVALLAPLAVQGMKKHLNLIARGALDADALQHDISRTLQSADLQEGRAAWAEKRPPRFRGA